MIGLEVHLNERRLCTAGADDLAVLSAILTVGGALGSKTVRNRRDAPTPTLHIGGMTGSGGAGSDLHLRWCRDATVSVGDVVSLRLVDIEPVEADAPAPDTAPSEDSERRTFERVKAQYFALRDKYEAREL